MADEPIQFRRTVNPTPAVIESADGTTLGHLRDGEPAVALAPGNVTKLWIGDGTGNRLLLSTDLVNDSPLMTAGYLKLTDAPAGSVLQLQYNDNGAFGAANVTVAPNANSLTAPGQLIVNRSTTNPMPIDGLPGTTANFPVVGALELQETTLGVGLAIRMTAFGYNILQARRVYGTPAAPLPCNNGNPLFAFRAGGWDGETWSGGDGGTSVGIDFLCSNNHRSANPGPETRGTRIDFRTTLTDTPPTHGVHMQLRQGVQIGASGFCAASVNDLGVGNLNVQNGYYLSGQKFGGFPQTVAWAANTDPNNVAFFTNRTDRTLIIRAISGVVEVANGSAATVKVVKADNTVALSAGQDVHTTAEFNCNLNPGHIQNLTLAATPMTLPNGWRLGLRTTAPSGFTDSVASITVYLEQF